MISRTIAQRVSVSLGALAVSPAWVGLAAAQPKPAPPPPTGAPPRVASETVEPLPAPNDVALKKLELELQAVSNGLTASAVARRAEMTSAEVRAKQYQVEAAAARVDQAVISFFPRLGFNARFAKLSPITLPALGNVVGTQQPGPVYATCVQATNQCVVNGLAVPLAFTSIDHLYALQGSVAIPLSDYLLRIPQNHKAATTSEAAARVRERAARLKVQRDARVAYYNWIRARGATVVAKQGLETAHEHLKDVTAAVEVGTASQADRMRVESQVAALELTVERSQNLALLAEQQLRVMMHDPSATQYTIGEDIFGTPPSPPAESLASLMQESTTSRLEPKALEESARALRKSRSVVKAGQLPRLDAFANLYHQNPNTRYFPQKDEWHTTWDVGVQLSWTVNDTFSSGAQAAELEAQAAELEAQAAQVRDGIRLETTQAYQATREAQVALGTSQRQVQAAQESLRVRRELFRLGRATSTEYTDAENDVVRSQLDRLNALVDARIARVNLEHALGRDNRER